MKKNFILVACVAIVALAAMNIYQNSNRLNISGLVLANVEALANETEGGGESGTDVKYCTMHIPCFDEKGNPTGKNTASSYTGPGCKGVYHSHTCIKCNKVG